MSLFKEILDARHLSSAPKFLWELKISATEYESLRQDIKYSFATDKIKAFSCEAVLYYAEWYRRESKSLVSKEEIWNSLGINDKTYADAFFELALQGAKELSLQIIKGNKEWAFRSLLYQGGLPLNRYMSEDSESNFATIHFRRSLISSDADFSKFDVGEIGNKSESLSAFYLALKESIENEDQTLLPLAKNEAKELYNKLKAIVVEEKKRYSERYPVVLDWVMNFDEIAKLLLPQYHIKAPDVLSQSFLQEQNIEDDYVSFLTIDDGEETVKTHPYNQGYSRTNLDFTSKYLVGNTISVSLSGSNPIIEESLCFDEPLLFYAEGLTYLLGNKLGKTKSRMVLPKGWRINDTSLSLSQYRLQGSVFDVVDIEADFSRNEIVCVSEQEEVKTFVRNQKLYKTFVEYEDSCYDKDLNRYLFLNGETKVYLVSQYEERIPIDKIVYRAKGQKLWTEEMPIGVFSAKPADASNKDVLAANNLLNLGKSFCVKTSIQNDQLCHIYITWEEGKVEIPEANKLGRNEWSFGMNDWSISSVKLILTPSNNTLGCFNVNLNLPGRGLKLLDGSGIQLEDGDVVSLKEYHSCKYILDGECVEFTAGCRNDKYELKRSKKNYQLFRNNRYERNIKKCNFINVLTGLSLKADIESAIDSLYHKDSYDISYINSQGEKVSITFTPYLYSFDQNDCGDVSIQGKSKRQHKYNNEILYLPLNNCAQKPFSIQTRNGIAKLSNIIEHGDIILFDSDHLVKPDVIYGASTISDFDILNITDSKLGDDVMTRLTLILDNVFKYDLPIELIDEVKDIACSKKNLAKIFMERMTGCTETAETKLINNLLSLESGLGFMWFWLIIDFCEHADDIDSNDQKTQTKLLLWALSNSTITDLTNIDYNAIKGSFIKACNNIFAKLRLASIQRHNNMQIEKIDANPEFFYKTLLSENRELTLVNQQTLQRFLDNSDFCRLREDVGFRGNYKNFVTFMIRKVANCMLGNIDILKDENEQTRLSLVYLFQHQTTLSILMLNNLLKNIHFQLK